MQLTVKELEQIVGSSRNRDRQRIKHLSEEIDLIRDLARESSVTRKGLAELNGLKSTAAAERRIASQLRGYLHSMLCELGIIGRDFKLEDIDTIDKHCQDAHRRLRELVKPVVTHPVAGPEPKYPYGTEEPVANYSDPSGQPILKYMGPA